MPPGLPSAQQRYNCTRSLIMSDQSTYSTPFPAPLTDAQTKSLEHRALECLHEDGVEDPESTLER